jgi:hypothetical protein
VEPLEVLKITIKKWVLVIPSYLHRELAVANGPDVINLMADRFSLYTIDELLYFKTVPSPAEMSELASQTLGDLGFTPTSANQGFDRNAEGSENIFQFAQAVG